MSAACASDTNNAAATDAAASGYVAGSVLAGKYTLDGLAGEGAMGVVWYATNTTLDMPVAIKLLRRSGKLRRHGRPTLGAGFNVTLLREAQATAKIVHPSIVRVLDFGVSDLGDPFIVMERLRGEDLRDRLNREGTFSMETAVQLVLPVAHAMHAAHLKGIVHRDLKPENIFLSLDESDRLLPKVVDFGIAHLPWEGADNAVSAGTPQYVAPEQLSGDRKADHRVDVYSLCVVLFELIVGAPPELVAMTRTDSRRARGGPNTVTALAPHVSNGRMDASLASILERGLKQSAADRYETMEALGRALAQWLIDRGIEDDEHGTSLRHRWLTEGSPQSVEQVSTVDSLRVVHNPTAHAQTVDTQPRSTARWFVVPLAVVAIAGIANGLVSTRPGRAMWDRWSGALVRAEHRSWSGVASSPQRSAVTAGAAEDADPPVPHADGTVPHADEPSPPPSGPADGVEKPAIAPPPVAHARPSPQARVFATPEPSFYESRGKAAAPAQAEAVASSDPDAGRRAEPKPADSSTVGGPFSPSSL